jgi:methylmalonyl-CoA mutase
VRKNLQHIKLDTSKSTVEEEDLQTKSFVTTEGIVIKSAYSDNDLLNIEHLDFGAGFPPYLRGVYSTMYIRNPWVINQHQRFSTAKESNSFYKRNLDAGQKGLSIVFDLPTQKGYDSDHNLALDDVGKAGVAIDTVEDMKILFDQIPLHEISVSMTMNKAILPLLAFCIVAAEEQGIKPEQLSGSIQNDILNEFILENKQIYSPEFLIAFFECVQKKMPKFNPISISGNAIQEAGATADIELAYTLAYGLEYIKTRLNTGIKIDDFAPDLSFSFGIGMNHFMEIAKLRAARMIWAKLVQQFNPQNPKSLALQIHSKTSQGSLTIQAPFNNISRTCIEASAAIFGGTQSLQTNLQDETNKLEFSTRIARDTQLYLLEETKITKTVDPWGGSYYLENLTHELVQSAWNHIEEIEKLGGLRKAIETGIPKLRMEEAAARKQARIDKEEDIIVGINKYQLEKEEIYKTQIKDHNIICEGQLLSLRQVKATRNFENLKVSLNKLRESKQNDIDDLLKLTIEAARNRATIGEINDALESALRR